jgi:hypothetical protein
MRYIKLILALLLIPLAASAQFYVTGDDPGRLKWKSIDTESYRVIYPEGSDSLADVYARKLEKYKIPISRTSGYMTGDGDGKIMPVVLHAYNDANGSVAWAPKRMDLFSIPSAYDPEPMPWSTMLSVHESRHVSQMQFGLTEWHKPGKWIIGQGWNILTFLLYPKLTNCEGDAVEDVSSQVYVNSECFAGGRDIIEDAFRVVFNIIDIDSKGKICALVMLFIKTTSCSGSN